MELGDALVYGTAQIFHRADGKVIDHGDYRCIRTPDNPTFFWGNYLLFNAPPKPGDLARWEVMFEAEIASRQPQSRHRAFGWLGPRGDTAQFSAAGYTLSESVALACQQPSLPPHAKPQIEVRPLQSEADWQAAIALQVLCRAAVFAEADYRAFKQAQFASYRRMVEAGIGYRYGAWCHGVLVAELGIFRGEGGLARYQNVCTHPDWRRQGMAGSLVYQAGIHALAALDARKLVIVAEEEGPQRLYRNLGFVPEEIAYGVDKAPPQAQ